MTQPTPDPRHRAYDAVYAYLGDTSRVPGDVVARNALVWRAVHAALDAALGAPAPAPTPEVRRSGPILGVEALVTPPRAAATGDDACRPVEVDGETVRVRGAGELTEQEQGYVADIVRAARRKYAVEHPAAADDADRAARRDRYAAALYSTLEASPRRSPWATLGPLRRSVWYARADAAMAVADAEQAALRSDCQLWADAAATTERVRRRHAADADQYEAQLRRDRDALAADLKSARRIAIALDNEGAEARAALARVRTLRSAAPPDIKGPTWALLDAALSGDPCPCGAGPLGTGHVHAGTEPPASPTMPEPTPTPIATAYFIRSRPAPDQPWQTPTPRWTTEDRAKALALLARRREQQPHWEHELMERVITVTVRPATEDLR